jgi:hypothetical protein
MSHQFAPGDDLIFQLESGLGLLRILAIDGEGAETVWHLLAYDEFFPSVEAAEAALAAPESLSVRKAHMALTDRAFERTPAARLGNRPLSEAELGGYREWQQGDAPKISDRSALLLLGVR